MVARERGSDLKGPDDGQHVVQIPARNKNGGIGEELLPGAAGQDIMGVVAQLTGQIDSDCLPIESGAGAVLVQPFGFRLFWCVIGWLQERFSGSFRDYLPLHCSPVGNQLRHNEATVMGSPLQTELYAMTADSKHDTETFTATVRQ